MKEFLDFFRNRKPMTRKQLLFKLMSVFIVIFAVAADYITKQIVTRSMELYEEIPVWNGVFHWKYIQNTGAAFGILKNSREVFMVISVIAIIVMAVYLVLTRTENVWWIVGISLLVGGGIGNMIDRIALGYVIDFMYVALIDFAIFNVADCFVCIGVGILLLMTLLDLINETKAQKAAKKGDSHHDA